MHFRILGDIADIETIATGPAFAKSHARGNVMAADGGGNVRGSQKSRSLAVHWYEATGIGRREFKIKRLL
jgi:hypothetical protein